MAQSTTNLGSSRKSSRLRLWIVAFLGLCALLAIPGWILWPILRPLTDVEQRLVGSWRVTTTSPVVTFHADRTVTTPGFPPTTWYIRDNTLRTTDSFLVGLVQFVFGRHVDQSVKLTFVDDNNIAANEGKQSWQRVTSEKVP